MALEAPAPTIADSGELSVLSYNVKGLRPIARGQGAKRRLTSIAPLLRRYDVALLQEVFHYIDRLQPATDGAISVHGNGGVTGVRRMLHPEGAGLLMIFRSPRIELVDEDSEAFNICSGWWRGANDCMARKGYARARVRSGGVLVNVYTLHLDAGHGEGDREARWKQLDLLSDRVQKQTGNSALIIAGDFNLDWYTTADRATIEQFVHRLGLQDAGIRADVRRWRESIDYIFYKSGGGVSLEMRRAGVDSSFEPNGKPLSDHPAVFAVFRVH